MEVSNVFGSHELMRFNYAEALAKGPTREAEFDADVLGAIDRHGFVVIEDALPVSTCERLLQEMRPYIDATPHGLHGLGGTRRVGALVARSSASHQMISHPGILRLVDSILAEQQLNGDAVKIGGKEGKGRKDFRYPWQLHLTQIIDVGPGGGTEEMPHGLRLHRANGMWLHDFQAAGLDLQVEVMWALSDFTEANGATHVVLGSHRDEPRGGDRGYRQPTIQAVMPRGSALVWTGWSIHGAGVNTTTDRRLGMNINFALGFLAQEENQLLACPPYLARKLPKDMQRLIGYRQPAGALNYVAECQSPGDSVLREDFDVLVPGAHGHQMNPAMDGPTFAPVSKDEFDAKLVELAKKKMKAIESDDLERALHYKNAMSVLKRSDRI
ncbi:MAG TPA: hypothetical protein EYM33_08325 [Pseudomonadales bacterium]|nr:hypothetical protein [Pseudomonadales bacterium]